MYFKFMILRIDNHVNDKDGSLVESITPAFDDEGKPILMAMPLGFKGKTVLKMIVNRNSPNKHEQAAPIEFPIEAKDLIDAFNNFTKFRDMEIDNMRSIAVKRQMAGGPKVEFEILEG
ncbi:hypothetical protein CCP1ISM_160007 [Azospirillaceae bacterium]